MEALGAVVVKVKVARPKGLALAPVAGVCARVVPLLGAGAWLAGLYS